MEWKLFASIAGFAVVGISVAASVLLDRDSSSRGSGMRASIGSSIDEVTVSKLEGAKQEEYDHIVNLGGGARALTREIRWGSRVAGPVAGRAEDSTVEDKDKSYDNRGVADRVLNRC